MPDHFDLIVVGAGPGGYVAAIRAAQLGKTVACIDKRLALGGTCLNVGCIPSKALLDSSEWFAVANNKFSRHGIMIDAPRLDLPAMLRRKDHVVKGLTDGVAYLFKKNRITAIHGVARLISAREVEATASDGARSAYSADAILLATGSEPATLACAPFDGTRIVSSTEALEFDAVPSHLLVVGGGYIGLEIGSVWARLGAKVTVLEFLPRIIPHADGEVATLLQRLLAKQGLEFHLDAKVVAATRSDAGVELAAEQEEQRRSFQGDRVLVAVGRRPYTAGLGLESIGVNVDPRSGRVAVDGDFQTNVEGVYAIGDLIQGPMLAHKAEEEGVAFAEHLAGHGTHVNYAAMPSVIYTWPEVASVGLSEEQVKESGQPYRIGKFPFTANGRARCMDDTDGLVKVIAHAETDRLLGVHIIGPRASDMIAEVVAFFEYAATAEDIARTCHAHPTLSEAVREAALAVDGRALHA